MPSTTEGFKVGEKKTVEEYQNLGEALTSVDMAPAEGVCFPFGAPSSFRVLLPTTQMQRCCIFPNCRCPSIP